MTQLEFYFITPYDHSWRHSIRRIVENDGHWIFIARCDQCNQCLEVSWKSRSKQNRRPSLFTVSRNLSKEFPERNKQECWGTKMQDCILG